MSTPDDWQQRRFDAIIACRKAGLSYAAIGAAIGVSRQAIYEFVHSYVDREKGAA